VLYFSDRADIVDVPMSRAPFIKPKDRGPVFQVQLIAVFGVLVAFTVVDIIMCRWLIDSLGIQNIHPYHLAVLWILYMTIVGVVAALYFAYTLEPIGFLALFVSGTFMMLGLWLDILYYGFQGKPLPEQWTWLWFGAPVNLTVVLTIALSSLALIMIVAFVYTRKARRLKVVAKPF